MAERISVALATFNGAAYLTEQLRSIRAQTVPVDELILADDGSTDSTLDRARAELSDWSGRLVVLPAQPQPLGVTGNFERALAACTGDLVALSDQDDVWHPNKLERMIGGLGDGLLAFSDADLVDEYGLPLEGSPRLFQGLGLSEWERTRLRDGEAWGVLLRRNVVTGATVLLRRDVLTLAGSFPTSWVHDEWLAVVAAVHGGLRLVDEPTIDYRQHSANQIGMRARLTLRDRISRLASPRSSRNMRLLERASALAERATGWPGLAGPDAAAKLAHEIGRSALPASRLRRAPWVVAAWRRGDYRRFGLGAQDALRDLVQPV
ncbi:MAG TPA: glycosyltransferase family 2 protein [Microbacteriaceae bacterium]|nr:glycosyltransferase family 2 protein [Microbacteriaceae bacterium]